MPFVGAGFSYGSRQRQHRWKSLKGRMPSELHALLDGILVDTTGAESPAGRTLHGTRVKGADSLSRLAELGSVLVGAREVCEELHIEQYAEMQPLASHRYLAYLVREGLFREVFTTNYDCCLETAFAETLQAGTEPEKLLAVVASLEDYRAKSADHIKPGHLVLYKINGCARIYGEQKLSGDLACWDRAAERIILTERQLQNFRGEAWVQDLIRDRARTRSYLFSGFGSEEPQVRHTVLTLIDEFSGGYCQLGCTDVMDLPNAPFVQVYDSELSFYQLQILIGFLDAHSQPIRVPGRPDLRIEAVFRNVFAGTPGRPLEASTFFERLFILVFCMLVAAAAKNDSTFAYWLRHCTPQFQLWLNEFRNVPWGKRVWRTLIPMLRTGDGTISFPLPFWRLLYSMRYPERELPTDFYLPLREDPLLIMVTLLLLGRLVTANVIGPRYDLMLPHTENTGENRIQVRLIHEHAVESIYEQPPTAHPGRLLRFISVPSRRPRPTGGRLQARHKAPGGGIPQVRIGRWALVSAEDLIAKAVRPDQLATTLIDCFAETRPVPAARLVRIAASGQ